MDLSEKGRQEAREGGEVLKKEGYVLKYLPDAAKAKVDEAIALAAARSACTCEICGAEGRLYNRDGWLATACPEHAKGELKPIRPGFENIHIVRTFGPGRFPIVSCRRYIRETDSFVDVDPRMAIARDTGRLSDSLRKFRQ